VCLGEMSGVGWNEGTLHSYLGRESLQDALGKAPGVYVGTIWKERTYKHPRSRRIPTRYLLWKVGLASMANAISSIRVLLPNIKQPIEVPTMTPRLIQQLIQYDLCHPARILGRNFMMPDESFHDLLRSCDPANSSAWAYHFGERIQSQDTTIDVHAEV
jgi:hypothetical protein